MATDRDTNLSEIEDESELDEEPGEVIESAPPLRVGEEREIHSCGLKKKLLEPGHGWESPELGDEVTVHYVGTLLDGTKFDSSKDRGEPFTFKLGHGQVVSGLDHGIITMKKGEAALFTVPSHLGYGTVGANGVPPNSDIQFEVELISWITIMDVCKDGGIIKKILKEGEKNEQPGDLDEVTVKYHITLADGTLVAQSPEDGIEFYVKDGHFCPALPKALKTMKRGEKVELIIQPQYAFGDEGKDADSQFPAIPPSSVLNIDLKLLSFKPVIDVTGDSKVLKKILKEGEGVLSPNEGAAVTIRYTAKLEDGTVFERKGFNGEGPLEFVTDEEQVIPGLDRVAMTMKKAELSILTISPDYGFGSSEVKRDLATVPSYSTVVYEVEMLDFINEKAPWEMSNCEKIEASKKKKEEGNILFKSGKYEHASKRYDKAVDCISEGESFGDDEQKLAKSLRVSCWLNGAACCLKLNDFHGAIKLTSKVLDIEFYNVKALYRRAQAYMETADLDLAELDIKKALQVDPQSMEVKSIQKTLKRLQAESNKRDAKFFTNMFSRMANDSSMVKKKRLKVDNAENTKRDEDALALEAEKEATGSVLCNPEIFMDSC